MTGPGGTERIAHRPVGREMLSLTLEKARDNNELRGVFVDAYRHFAHTHRQRRDNYLYRRRRRLLPGDLHYPIKARIDKLDKINMQATARRQQLEAASDLYRQRRALFSLIFGQMVSEVKPLQTDKERDVLILIQKTAVEKLGFNPHDEVAREWELF